MNSRLRDVIWPRCCYQFLRHVKLKKKKGNYNKTLNIKQSPEVLCVFKAIFGHF